MTKVDETCVYLLRHGQTIADLAGVVQGQAESDIGPLGWVQPKQLARRFQTVEVNVVSDRTLLEE